jgi:hypothetical protein
MNPSSRKRPADSSGEQRKPFRDFSSNFESPLRSSFLQLGKAMNMKSTNSENREGFLVSQRPFNLPEDSVNLDPKTKRPVTICNLFVNHRLSIDYIANLLDEDRRTVILALIHRHILYDRRHKPGSAPSGTERRMAQAAIKITAEQAKLPS